MRSVHEGERLLVQREALNSERETQLLSAREARACAERANRAKSEFLAVMSQSLTRDGCTVEVKRSMVIVKPAG